MTNTVARLQDRESILETILQLGRGLDAQDVDGCSTCFTENAQWDADLVECPR
jgi:SnoaL-like domain